MGYTDYMGLPDDLFFNEVFKLYENIDKDNGKWVRKNDPEPSAIKESPE